MALMDVTKSANMNPLTRLQHSIEDDFRELIIAFMMIITRRYWRKENY